MVMSDASVATSSLREIIKNGLQFGQTGCLLHLMLLQYIAGTPAPHGAVKLNPAHSAGFSFMVAEIAEWFHVFSAFHAPSARQFQMLSSTPDSSPNI
jgi:hypothetical protein